MLLLLLHAGRPISSEEEAWELLDEIRHSDPDARIALPPFKTDWVKINLHYEGPGYDATLTPSMMESLLTLQSAIRRSYAIAKYGDDRGNRLTDQDKYDTEISVKIQPGTTGVEVDGTKIANHFLDLVAGHMTGNQIVEVVIAALLLYFGSSGLKISLDYYSKKHERKLEATERAEAREADVRRTIEMSKEETRRLEIMKDIASSNQKVALVQAEAIRVVESQLKSISRTDKLEVQGTSISGPVAADIISSPRASAEFIRLKSIFKIESVDSSSSEGFRARIKDVSEKGDGDTIVATLKDTFLSEREGETVRRAFWQKKLVTLVLDAKLLRGQIKEAEIVEAHLLQQDAPGEVP